MKHYYLIKFGAAYGEGSYGEGSYSCASVTDPECVTTAAPGTGSDGSSSGGSAGGALADTGVLVVFMITAACLLVFVALVVRIWRRKPQTVFEPVKIEKTDKSIPSR